MRCQLSWSWKMSRILSRRKTLPFQQSTKFYLHFVFHFQVSIFFIMAFFSTFTFLRKLHVSHACILGQAGSEKSWRWIVLWDVWAGAGSLHWRQPLELSTCWNYFLSGRQDVIKLKDTGLGQNNKERNQVWKLFSRGLTANQEKF